MATFPMTPLPDPSTGRRNRPRVVKNEFDDGYTERARQGINSNLEEWQVNWNHLQPDEIGVLLDFLNARAGVESFEWTPPPPDDNRVRVVVCEEWDDAWDSAVTKKLTATFKEVALP